MKQGYLRECQMQSGFHRSKQHELKCWSLRVGVRRALSGQSREAAEEMNLWWKFIISRNFRNYLWVWDKLKDRITEIRSSRGLRSASEIEWPRKVSKESPYTSKRWFACHIRLTFENLIRSGLWMIENFSFLSTIENSLSYFEWRVRIVPGKNVFARREVFRDEKKAPFVDKVWVSNGWDMIKDLRKNQKEKITKRILASKNWNHRQVPLQSTEGHSW